MKETIESVIENLEFLIKVTTSENTAKLLAVQVIKLKAVIVEDFKVDYYIDKLFEAV